MEHITRTSMAAEESVNETLGFSDETNAIVKQLSDHLENQDLGLTWLERKVDAVLKHLNIEDPRVTPVKQGLKRSIALKWGPGRGNGPEWNEAAIRAEIRKHLPMCSPEEHDLVFTEGLEEAKQLAADLDEDRAMIRSAKPPSSRGGDRKDTLPSGSRRS